MAPLPPEQIMWNFMPLPEGYHTAPYSNMDTNEPMAEAMRANMDALGVQYQTMQEDLSGPAGGSTDMGNVSHVVPTIHPMFAIETSYGNRTCPQTPRKARNCACNLALTSNPNVRVGGR